MNENPRPYLAFVYDGAFEDGYSAISADGDCLFGEGKTRDEAIAMLELAVANYLHAISEWDVEVPPPLKREQLEKDPELGVLLKDGLAELVEIHPTDLPSRKTH